jgi:hypothetical protein
MACQEGMDSESPEPPAGRLVLLSQTESPGRSYLRCDSAHGRDCDEDQELSWETRMAGVARKRFAAYLAELARELGDSRRYAAMISHCTGLLLPSERKSVEPMADANRGTAPVYAAFRWAGGVVGRGCEGTYPCLLDAGN